jgi:hypothetical protein
LQFGTISLEYGAKAVRNALFLQSRESNASSGPTVVPPVNNTHGATPSGPNTSPVVAPPEEDTTLRQAILAAAAYIALASSNAVVALSYSKELLNVKKCTELYR